MPHHLLRVGVEGFQYGGNVGDFVQIRIVDEIHNQTLFGAVSDTCADDAADFFHQLRFAFDFFVVLENQLQDVIQIDFLRFEQIHLKNHIVPVDF